MPQPPTPSISIFYSYAPEDEALSQQLEKHLSSLRRQSIITTWHARKVQPGADWTQEIHTHMQTAHIILLLVSSDFLASDYCYGIELQQALERQKTGAAHVIPIIVRDVDWQLTPFAHLTPLPTGGYPVLGNHWHTVDQAWTNVAEGIRKVAQSITTNDPPPPSEHLWNIPYRRNPFFTGREELLTQLHQRLNATGSAVLTQSQAQAISGLGGIGKTQTAVEYAYRYRDEYQYILWVGATPETIATDFATLARLLHLPEPNPPDQPRLVATIIHWLDTHKGWLLIFDNADDLEIVRPYLPSTDTGHILLTTRAQATGSIAEPLFVEKMDRDEGVALLLRRARLLDCATPEDRQTATQIVQIMDGLPLALEQAGAYIEQTGCGLAGYLRVYNQRGPKLFHKQASLSPDYPHTVATTWDLSFKQIEQSDPASANLLRLCAFLDPDAIPLELFTKGAAALDRKLKAIVTDEAALNNTIEPLRRYSLLKRTPDGNSLTIHRLVQLILKDGMTANAQRQYAERVVRMMYLAFPAKRWQPVSHLLPQVFNCAALMAQYNFTFDEAYRLLNQASVSLGDNAQFLQARQLLLQALRSQEQASHEPSTILASTLHRLGWLAQNQGDYAAAREYLEHALAMEEKVLPEAHLNKASTLHELGRLVHDQGDSVTAREYLERALAMKEKVLLEAHPSTATTLHELGRLAVDQGDYETAREYLERALVMEEKVLPEAHHSIAVTLHVMGRLAYRQGDYETAREYLERALVMEEKVLPEVHPSIAITLQVLGVVMYNQKDSEAAREYLGRALAMHGKVLLEAHPDTAAILWYLAFLDYEQQRYKEAESGYQRALAIYERTLPPDHPYIADILDDYASLLKAINRPEEAAQLEARARVIRAKRGN